MACRAKGNCMSGIFYINIVFPLKSCQAFIGGIIIIIQYVSVFLIVKRKTRGNAV